MGAARSNSIHRRQSPCMKQPRSPFHPTLTRTIEIDPCRSGVDAVPLRRFSTRRVGHRSGTPGSWLAALRVHPICNNRPLFAARKPRDNSLR